MSHFPLLNALRTFVVGARHLNFTNAADELQVSPSAVSHQIRLLEKYLEIPLFVREARKLRLTDEGEMLRDRLSKPFTQITEAIEEMRLHCSSSSVRVLCRPFFSSVWLAPRLSSFWTTCPNIDLSLIHTSSFELTDIEQADVAILWGRGNWSGLDSTLIIPGMLTPVMHRSLAETLGIPKSPADLARYTLLHEESRLNWSKWLTEAGAPHVTGANAPLVDDTNVRLQSVMNGQGIMLSSPILLQDHLDRGELIRPFELTLDDYSYYLAFPSKRPVTRRTRRFVDWLLAECHIGA